MWPQYPGGAPAAGYGAYGFMAVPQVPAAPSTQPGAWREYATPEGKKYWSDGIQSVWEEPPAYKEAREKAMALRLRSVRASTSRGATLARTCGALRATARRCRGEGLRELCVDA